MATEIRVIKKDSGYYRITSYYSSHTGVVEIKVKNGIHVEEGDLLYTITRLGLIKKRLVEDSGIVENCNTRIDKTFCGYYTPVLTIKHELTPEEVQDLEEERDYSFVFAPQSAQYYITTNPGMPPIINVGNIVKRGDIIAIAMVMKKRREIIYDGEPGKIAKIYFINGQQCKEGDKLLGMLSRPIKDKK